VNQLAANLLILVLNFIPFTGWVLSTSSSSQEEKGILVVGVFQLGIGDKNMEKVRIVG